MKESFNGSEQLPKISPIEDKLKTGLSPLLMENGMDYDEDILNQLNDFNITINNKQLSGKEGFSEVIKVLDGNENYLDLILFEIKESGYIDFSELTSYIEKYIGELILKNKSEEIQLEKEEIIEEKKNNKDILKNVYSNFNIDKLNSFKEYLGDAKSEIDKYLIDNPEDEKNRDELIYSYILIKNRNSIIDEYKSKISEGSEYTENGLQELTKSIDLVENNINNNYSDFSEYIYNNRGLNHTLDKSKMPEILKSKIKNSFGGIDNNEDISINGDEVIINNKRITIKNGQVSAELFKDNFSIPLEIDYPIELSKNYFELSNLNNNLKSLNKEKIFLLSKIDLKELEMNDYISEGNYNFNIERNEENIKQYREHVEKINSEILIIERKILTLQNSIQKQELENKRNVKIEGDRVKNVMDFLDDIGFSMLPQSMTNKLIENLNGHRGLASQLGFNSEINFSKGTLGIEKDMDINNISSAEKKAFARFFNIFISGSDDEPINLIAINKGYNPIGDRNKFRIMLQTQGMLNGDISLNRGYSNIEKFNSSDKTMNKPTLNKTKLKMF